MFKKLLLALGLFTIVAQAHYTNFLEEDYLVLQKKKKSSWGSKYIRSIGYGIMVGAPIGAVCGYYDKLGPVTYVPLHWCAALVARKVVGEVIIDQELEEGRPVANNTFWDASMLSSWASWIYIMFGYSK